MRYQKLDALRGMAIILMAAFHANYLLVHIFGNHIIDFSVWYLIGKISAVLFIYVFGVSFFLSSKDQNSGVIWKKSFLRMCIFGSVALGITGVTYFFLPREYIVFGVIHFFAVTSLFMPIFVRFGTWNGIIGMMVVFLGGYLSSVRIENPWLFPIGLVSSSFFSADYYPIFPWFGVVLIGYGMSAWLERRSLLEKMLRGDVEILRWLAFLGRHSLLIYLLHAPILYGLMWLVLKI